MKKLASSLATSRTHTDANLEVQHYRRAWAWGFGAFRDTSKVNMVWRDGQSGDARNCDGSGHWNRR